MAEPFNPQLFVGRRGILDNLIAWATGDPPANQVWSVVGPPGVGKSYLAHQIHRELSERPNQLVFWINLTRDASIRGTDPDVAADGGDRLWLRQSVDKARARSCGRKVRPYDGGYGFEAVLDTLTADLCAACADHAPTLIVDGFEEIDAEQRLKTEERILAIFTRRSCTRLLIFRRDENALQSTELRWKERKLALNILEATESQDQLKTRLDYWSNRPNRLHATGPLPITSAILADLELPNSLPPYDWNHPGLNTLLLERAVYHYQLGQRPLISKVDADECLRTVTATNGVPLTNPEFKRLTDLANTGELGDEWTERDLYRLNITIDDTALKTLFERGIVINRERTPRYLIAPGLRQMVQAWTRLP